MKNFLMLLLSLSSLSASAQSHGPLLDRLPGTWVGQCQFLGGYYIPRVTFDGAGHRMHYQRLRYGGRDGCVPGREPFVEEAGDGIYYGLSEDVNKLIVVWQGLPNHWYLEEMTFRAQDRFFWSHAGHFSCGPNGLSDPWGSPYYPGPMEKQAATQR